MNYSFCMPISAVSDPFELPLRSRSLIIVMVALVHVALLWFWVAMPVVSKPVQHEMSVSIIMPSPPPAAPVEPKPVPPPLVKPKPVEPKRVKPAPKIVEPVAKSVEPVTPVTPVESVESVAPVETPAPPSPPVVDSTPVQPVKAPAAMPDREPDYQAAYLNNPTPKYPMVARRMGWQGRVVLNVEVLASGLPGQIKIHQSSGHEVLDKAALNAVRTWRFVPARHNGEEVTRNFLVPIPFKLKEG